MPRLKAAFIENTTMDNLLKYSLDCEQPKLASSFFPTPKDENIALFLDDDYEFYHELMELVIPILNANGYSFVNLSRNQRVLDIAFNCFDCSMRQQAWLVESSVLNISYDAHWSHLFAKNNVSISDSESLEQNAKNILAALDIEREVEVYTKLIGPSYGLDFVEIIPDFEFPKSCSLPKDSIVHLRCDLFENWKFAIELVNRGYQTTVCCVQPPPKQIAGFLGGVHQICIFPNKESKEEDVKILESLGIKYILILDGHCQETKLNLFNCKNVVVDTCWGKKNLDKLKAMEYDTRIKFTRQLLSKDGAFASVYHWKNKLPIGSLSGDIIGDGVDDDEFLKEADIFYYYNKHERRNSKDREEGSQEKGE